MPLASCRACVGKHLALYIARVYHPAPAAPGCCLLSVTVYSAVLDTCFYHPPPVAEVLELVEIDHVQPSYSAHTHVIYPPTKAITQQTIRRNGQKDRQIDEHAD